MNGPNLDLPQVPDFEIRADGRLMASILGGQVLRIDVDDDVRLPGMFSIELAASDDPESGVLAWLDDENVLPIGSRVDVRMGYLGQLATVLVGEVTALEPEFATNRLPRLCVRGYDVRHRLQRGRHTRSFNDGKDSDAAKRIAREAGIPIDAKDSGVLHEYLMQANQTDLEFLLARADAIHYELLARGDKLLFRPVASSEGAALTLEVGAELLEFFVSCSTGGQSTEAVLNGWSVQDKAPITARAAAGSEKSRMGGSRTSSERSGKFGTATLSLSANPVHAADEAEQRARAEFEAMGLGFMQAEGLCRGSTDLRPGITVKVLGAGKRFGGLYYLTSVEHRYTPAAGYTTRFSARRNAL
jgi:phage protein D